MSKKGRLQETNMKLWEGKVLGVERRKGKIQ